MKKFTLIELLVVIAIIGILASMILPSLGKAKAKSQSAACLGNLKQQGLGIQTYPAYHNGFLPYAANGDGNPMGYRFLISPYINTVSLKQTPWRDFNPANWDRGYFKGVYKCPSSKSDVATYAGSYGWNHAQMGQDSQRVQISHLSSPSTTLLAGDGPTKKQKTNWWDWSYIKDRSPSKRHNNGQTGNYVMGDGSARNFTDYSIRNSSGQFSIYWYETQN
ncbi:MAG: prepilin-type N-terminal cleavage/methylation domain-containing protein [Lentisphaeraceae bacterium]|nr:prepilin-type N-terminal cleavage/methylation domain-containing protein [Lentisphaeraceae bacterium]